MDTGHYSQQDQFHESAEKMTTEKVACFHYLYEIEYESVARYHYQTLYGRSDIYA